MPSKRCAVMWTTSPPWRRANASQDMSQLDTSIELFGEKLSIPSPSRPWA